MLFGFHLSDEEITGGGLVATKSDDPFVVSGEFDALVIGRRDNLHSVDPRCAQDCIVRSSYVDNREFDGFCNVLDVDTQTDHPSNGLR